MALSGKGGGWELIRWLVDPTHVMSDTILIEKQCLHLY